MEDHIDKIVYIVIAVVISIVSAVAKANKKKKMKSVPDSIKVQPVPKPAYVDQTKEEYDYNDEFPEFIKENKSVGNSEVNTVNDQKTGSQNVSRKGNTIESSFYEDEEDNGVEREKHDFLKDFELKDAIIYSEILSRKY